MPLLVRSFGFGKNSLKRNPQTNPHFEKSFFLKSFFLWPNWLYDRVRRSVMGQPGSDSRSSEAWAELNARYRGPLLAYFFKRLQNRAEAEDLTQEAFIRLTVHPDRHNGQSMHAYVFTIASNLVKDRARSQTRRRAGAHRSLGDVFENVVTTPHLVEDRTPERVLMGKESLKQFIGVLGELSERTRDIFILSRLEGMHQRDIAKIYEISISAVEKHVLKAQAHFGARFKEP
jgi:RNA polymerase sigma-70 factor (ECF subfamily)